MTNSFGRLALHTWTIDTTPLGPALEAIRLAGYHAAELRRTDFKRCYEAGMSNDEVLAMIKKSGVSVAVLGVEYGWLFATGDESARIFEDFRVSCENAVALGCPQLMSAPGPYTGSLKDAVGHLRTAADIADEYGLELSIEFNSQHANLNSVETQRELVSAADKKNVGLLLDAYHLARSGRAGRDFEDVPGEDIMHFQYSDLSSNPVTGVKRPTDRLMPGKGVILWTEVFQLLHEKGYTGLLSFEAPNPEQWNRPPAEVCREGVELTQDLLRKAVPQYAP
ncbi:sugar phosphate isomerase/epimerase family protein [Pelagibacterium montanilacus]|uniref:sugar phosphate isomerase/epimerase family protein n=1 Tax=Pelagibacterium montanilacus TaxID=2185280 RepID=UPI000F8E23C8|nr:sugar phosphate isomerase/epimerase [Pelagibacterium montanilacus]